VIQNIWITNAAGSVNFSPSKAQGCNQCALIRVTSFDEYASGGFRRLENEREFRFIGEWIFDDDPEGFEFAMKKGQAETIKDFVDLVKDRVHTLLIHCDAGQSRSPALAISIARYLKMDELAETILADPAYKPNPWVRKLTGQVFGVEPTREEYQIMLEKLLEERK